MTGSRRNSDLGGLVPSPRTVESRRNSDVSCRSSERRGSDLGAIRPAVSRRASDCGSIRRVADLPTTPELHAADEATALVDGIKDDEEAGKTRKKNLSWKSDKSKDEQEDITAETSLLSDSQQAAGVTVRSRL